MAQVKLIDILTMEIRVVNTKADKWWWSTGNGSCDCNRELEFDVKLDSDCKADRYFILDYGDDLLPDIDFTETDFCLFNGEYDDMDGVLSKLD